MGVYLCPSSSIDPFIQGTPYPGPAYENDPPLLCPHYVGISGAAPDPAARGAAVCNAGSYGTSCRNGPLRPAEMIAFRDLIDGTSKPIIVAEQGGLVGDLTSSANYGGGWCGWGQTYNASQTTAGSLGHYFGPGITTVVWPINSDPGISASSGTVPYGLNTVLNSQHPGGVNALLADGAVNFVSETIDITALLMACSMDDGLVNTRFP